MDLGDVRYEEDGRVAVVTLDRAEARNAYSEAMVEGLVAAFDRADARDEVGALVLTGDGPAFHAGGDLKRMRDQRGMFAGEPPALRRAYRDGIQRVPRRIAALDKPIVAAVNGAAIGAGLDLACMCDVRFAAATAKLGSTFVRVGLIPGDGGAYYLARTVGLPRALELMLSARVIDAGEAERIGLVHRVVAPDLLLGEAVGYAARLATHPPQALALARQLAYRCWDASQEVALELAASHQALVQRTQEHHDAVDRILR